MTSLIKLRSERDSMSAIERRIADFILENAHLLRDYSSQQLADALRISQSSVVKFSQKLGYKGYPDLKYSVGEAMGRNDASEENGATPAFGDPHAALAERLWQAKAQAEQETRLINPPEKIDAIAAAIHEAGKVFLIGLGEDGIPARAFAMKLSLLGVLTVHHFDAVLMGTSMATAAPGDVLMVFSEDGSQQALCQLVREFRDRKGRVISVTRHSANPLRAQADASLLVSAHDDRSHVEPLLYQSALQQLLDLLFVLLCEGGSGRLALLDLNLQRVQRMLDA